MFNSDIPYNSLAISVKCGRQSQSSDLATLSEICSRLARNLSHKTVLLQDGLIETSSFSMNILIPILCRLLLYHNWIHHGNSDKLSSRERQTPTNNCHPEQSPHTRAFWCRLQSAPAFRTERGAGSRDMDSNQIRRLPVHLESITRRDFWSLQLLSEHC